MKKVKKEIVINSKRWGSEWTREKQRRKGGTPAPRGVREWEGRVEFSQSYPTWDANTNTLFMRTSHPGTNTPEQRLTNCWLPVRSNELVRIRTKQQITDKLLHRCRYATFWDTTQTGKEVQSFTSRQQINQRIKLWTIADVILNLITFTVSYIKIDKQEQTTNQRPLLCLTQKR